MSEGLPGSRKRNVTAAGVAAAAPPPRTEGGSGRLLRLAECRASDSSASNAAATAKSCVCLALEAPGGAVSDITAKADSVELLLANCGVKRAQLPTVELIE